MVPTAVNKVIRKVILKPVLKRTDDHYFYKRTFFRKNFREFFGYKLYYYQYQLKNSQSCESPLPRKSGWQRSLNRGIAPLLDSSKSLEWFSYTKNKNLRSTFTMDQLL